MEPEIAKEIAHLPKQVLTNLIFTLPNDTDWIEKQLYIYKKEVTDRELTNLQTETAIKEALSAELEGKIK